ALADPTRRDIVARLSGGDHPASASRLAATSPLCPAPTTIASALRMTTPSVCRPPCPGSCRQNMSGAGMDTEPTVDRESEALADEVTPRPVPLKLRQLRWRSWRSV